MVSDESGDPIFDSLFDSFDAPVGTLFTGMDQKVWVFLGFAPSIRDRKVKVAVFIESASKRHMKEHFRFNWIRTVEKLRSTFRDVDEFLSD